MHAVSFETLLSKEKTFLKISINGGIIVQCLCVYSTVCFVFSELQTSSSQSQISLKGKYFNIKCSKIIKTDKHLVWKKVLYSC